MQEVKTDKAPSPLGPYSQAVIANNMVYVAMQLPVNPNANDAYCNVETSIDIQTKQVLDNIKAVLEGAYTSLDNTVSVTVYLTDLADGLSVNPIYKEYFTGVLPARTVVNVSSLPFGYKIAVDVIAKYTK